MPKKNQLPKISETDIDVAFSEAGLDLASDAIELSQEQTERAAELAKKNYEKRAEGRKARAELRQAQQEWDKKQVEKWREKIQKKGQEDSEQLQRDQEAMALRIKKGAARGMRVNKDLLLDTENRQTQQVLEAAPGKKMVKIGGEALRKLQQDLQDAEIKQRLDKQTKEQERVKAMRRVVRLEPEQLKDVRATLRKAQGEKSPPATTDAEQPAGLTDRMTRALRRFFGSSDNPPDQPTA